MPVILVTNSTDDSTDGCHCAAFIEEHCAPIEAVTADRLPCPIRKHETICAGAAVPRNFELHFCTHSKSKEDHIGKDTHPRGERSVYRVKGILGVVWFPIESCK